MARLHDTRGNSLPACRLVCPSKQLAVKGFHPTTQFRRGGRWIEDIVRAFTSARSHASPYGRQHASEFLVCLGMRLKDAERTLVFDSMAFSSPTSGGKNRLATSCGSHCAKSGFAMLASFEQRGISGGGSARFLWKMLGLWGLADLKLTWTALPSQRALRLPALSPRFSGC